MAQTISIFDIFKIGVGPSSSHTLGPWKAALGFRTDIGAMQVDHLKIHLYGSLSKTGKGHATDKALIMGLLGYDPATVDTGEIANIISSVTSKKSVDIGSQNIRFDPLKDIVFEDSNHDFHPNTMRFVAYYKSVAIREEYILSIGGGFIEKAESVSQTDAISEVPFPIMSGQDLLAHTREQRCSLSDIVLKNELASRTQEEVVGDINHFYQTMRSSIYRGCRTDGVLPGGLNVSRRARGISESLLGQTSDLSQEDWFEAITSSAKSYDFINKWISCFALAVNEENAAMGRIVTSPTNGAAGVIPAVLHFYMLFDDRSTQADVNKFFLVAGQIGCLFKNGATISAAVGGCQAEIGVSSAMAAAGLCEVLGGSPDQCLMAAEIAMEHHLGLTCDPIGGLVQVPCIERNAMGAVKAITAANLALISDSCKAKLDLDSVIKVMWETAQDMNHKYKETSEGGLALSLPVIHPNC